MKRSFFSLTLFVLMLSGVIIPDVSAQSITANLPATISGSYTLSQDTVYLMTSTVRVASGGVLNIPAGTLIQGDNGAVLSISRGGKIHAMGTPGCPIIFTSAKPQGRRTPGDWGGIVIRGNATINATGGNASIAGELFGGVDDCDSSGVLDYVRIEYAGTPNMPDSTVSGLTLAGVGARTRIDNVQVSYAGDDAYAWHGGGVNGRHLIAFGSGDDDFDTDLGYQGRLQFLFAMRDSSRSDTLGSSGIESDNDANGSSHTPLTLPVVSNLTLVGPFSDTSEVRRNFRSGSLWRNNSRYGLFNSIITGYQTGIRMEGAGIGSLPPDCPQPTTLKLHNTVVSGDTVVWGANGVSLLDLAFWFVCLAGNGRPGNHPNVGLYAVDQAHLHRNDPRPDTTSIAASGTDFSDPLLTVSMSGTCSWWNFDSTSYKGAFNPRLPRNAQWDSAWTNYDPERTTYVKHHNGWNLVALANMPAVPHKDSIYHHTASSALVYNGSGYTADDTLDQQVGYWIKFDSTCTVEQVGDAVLLPVSLTVHAGWNLIATGASEPAAIANISTNGTTILSEFFTFDDGYRTTEQSLLPGRAYWVNVSTAGTITFNP